MSEQYKPNEWIAVVDAPTLNDKVLNDTIKRLESEGKQTRTRQTKEGYTLYVLGGYRA